jgi:hypothetical protein
VKSSWTAVAAEEQQIKVQMFIANNDVVLLNREGINGSGEAANGFMA